MYTIHGSSPQGDVLTSEHVPPRDALERCVLRGFNLRFEDARHEVKAVGVLQDGDQARFTLADNSFARPIEFAATYVPIDESAIVGRDVVGGSARGRASIPVGDYDPELYPLLQGFRFVLTDGHDRRVSAISVRAGNVIVDGPEPFRGRRIDLGFGVGGRVAPFEYTVQYLWVRRSALVGNYLASHGPSTTDLVASHLPSEALGQALVLSGFDLENARDLERSGSEVGAWRPAPRKVRRVAVDLGYYDIGASSTLVGLDDGTRRDPSHKSVSFGAL